MNSEFKEAMFRLSNLGQNIVDMGDCSELIPIPPPLPARSAQIPGEFSVENLTLSC